MKLPREVEQAAVREVFQHRQRMKDYEGSGDWAVVGFGVTFVVWVVLVIAAIYSILSLVF